MRILITGSNGLLGQKLVQLCTERKLDYLATSKGANRNPDCPSDRYFSMDITNKLEINQVFGSFYPTHVIHTAAITNVDYCELHPEECAQNNVFATQLLFEESKKFEAHFQLLSTDFVFDGLQGHYKESDPVGPLSVYAQSKVDAEAILHASSYTNWSIVRTIIVYGTAANLSRTNIVLWAIDSLQKGTEMRIVKDQFRMPTWALDLAWACLEIVARERKGTYHISGNEYYSMFDLVQKIAEILHLDQSRINAIDSKSLNQPAHRPPNTGFDLSKAVADLDYKPTPLAETLRILTQD